MIVIWELIVLMRTCLRVFGHKHSPNATWFLLRCNWCLFKKKEMLCHFSLECKNMFNVKENKNIHFVSEMSADIRKQCSFDKFFSHFFQPDGRYLWRMFWPCATATIGYRVWTWKRNNRHSRPRPPRCVQRISSYIMPYMDPRTNGGITVWLWVTRTPGRSPRGWRPSEIIF